MEALVRGVFAHLNEALAALDDGAVHFGKLGQFRVSNVERAMGGRRRTMRRVLFLARTPVPAPTPQRLGYGD